jgi:hypothetical protein
MKFINKFLALSVRKALHKPVKKIASCTLLISLSVHSYVAFAGDHEGACKGVPGMYVGDKVEVAQVDTGRIIQRQRYYVLEQGNSSSTRGSFITYELHAISNQEVVGTISTPSVGSWECKNGIVYAIAFDSFAYGTDLASIGGKSLINPDCVSGLDVTQCRQWAEYDRWSFKINFNTKPIALDYFLVGILQADNASIFDKNVPQTVGQHVHDNLRKLGSDGDSISDIVECDLKRITDTNTPGGTFGYSPNCH